MKWEPWDVRTMVEVGSEGSFGGCWTYLDVFTEREGVD